MKKRLIWGLFAMLGVACYDDLGNYDYNDINDMVLKMDTEKTVTIPKVDSTKVEILASVSQLDRKDNGNLSFLWKRNGEKGTWTECGTDSICTLYVYPEDRGTIIARVAITDHDQNIVTYGECSINLVTKFNRCWFVLQDVAGQAVLGAIDGEGKVAERELCQNVYQRETGGSLVGKPLFLSVNNMHRTDMIKNEIESMETLVGVFTEGGKNYMLDGATLENRYDYDELLFDKHLKGDNNYLPMFAEGDSRGEIIIDNGVVWYAKPDSYSVYYPVSAAEGDYFAEIATTVYTTVDGVNIVYDSKNGRFLSYVNSDSGGGHAWWNKWIRDGLTGYYDINGPVNAQKLVTIGERAGYPNKFDPNNIGGKEVIYMGATTSRDVPKVMAVATAGSGLCIYQISPEMIQGKPLGTEPICSGYWELTPEAGNMEEKLPVATSAYFDRMFYYAAGNKVYRADLTRSVPRSYLIYEHADASARITKLKFRSQREDRWDISGGDGAEIPYDFVSYLGAVVEYTSGKSSVVEMKLTRAGEVKLDDATKLPIVYEFGGFDKIVDFVYAFR